MSPNLEFLRPQQQPASASEPLLPWMTRHQEGELAVDVYETDKAVFIKTAIAGVAPEDLELSLNADLLTIRGVRHDQGHGEENRSYLCRECHWGAFSRTIILPGEVSTAKAEATFKSGLLLIKLPKTKKREDIKVKVEE